MDNVMWPKVHATNEETLPLSLWLVSYSVRILKIHAPMIFVALTSLNNRFRSDCGAARFGSLWLVCQNSFRPVCTSGFSNHAC